MSTTWTEWEPDQRLQLRQVLLAHTAKAGEFNVLEVDAPSTAGRMRIPIAILKAGKAGEQTVMQTNLEFPKGPVTFRLVEGTGPVHLMGQHLPPDPNPDGYDEEEELADELIERDDAEQAEGDDEDEDEDENEDENENEDDGDESPDQVDEDADEEDLMRLLESSDDEEDNDPENPSPKRRKLSPNFTKNTRCNY